MTDHHSQTSATSWQSRLVRERAALATVARSSAVSFTVTATRRHPVGGVVRTEMSKALDARTVDEAGAAEVLPGEGVIVHRKPLTVVVSMAGGPENVAPVLAALVDELITQDRCDFGSVAEALQNFVVAHQPVGVAAILDVQPDPIGFLFDQADITDDHATHRGDGRLGWNTVFVAGTKATARAGAYEDLNYGPAETWARLWAGVVPGSGATVPLLSLTNDAPQHTVADDQLVQDRTAETADEPDVSDRAITEDQVADHEPAPTADPSAEEASAADSASLAAGRAGGVAAAGAATAAAGGLFDPPPSPVDAAIGDGWAAPAEAADAAASEPTAEEVPEVEDTAAEVPETGDASAEETSVDRAGSEPVEPEDVVRRPILEETVSDEQDQELSEAVDVQQDVDAADAIPSIDDLLPPQEEQISTEDIAELSPSPEAGFDNPLDDTSLDDIPLDDTSLDDTSLDDTSLDDIPLDDTSAESLTAAAERPNPVEEAVVAVEDTSPLPSGPSDQLPPQPEPAEVLPDLPPPLAADDEVTELAPPPDIGAPAEQLPPPPDIGAPSEQLPPPPDIGAPSEQLPPPPDIGGPTEAAPAGASLDALPPPSGPAIDLPPPSGIPNLDIPPPTGLGFDQPVPPPPATPAPSAPEETDQGVGDRGWFDLPPPSDPPVEAVPPPAGLGPLDLPPPPMDSAPIQFGPPPDPPGPVEDAPTAVDAAGDLVDGLEAEIDPDAAKTMIFKPGADESPTEDGPST